MRSYSAEERKTLTMKSAMLYATTGMSIRKVADKLGIGKSTIHTWLTTVLPVIDPRLSKIVNKKIELFKKQHYVVKYNLADKMALNSSKRRKFLS